MRRRFDRFSRNGSKPSNDHDGSYTSPYGPIEVVQHTINSMHWYEAVDQITREHRQWMKSVTYYTGRAPKGIGFQKWLADKGWAEAERLKMEGGRRGAAVHRAQERLARGEEILRRDYSDEVIEHVLSFRNWYEEFMPQYLGREEMVFNLGQGVAGTLDQRYIIPWSIAKDKLDLDDEHRRPEIDGIHVVHDTKTGEKLYEDNWLQANKYADLRNGMGADPQVNVPVEWVALLRTNSRHKKGYEFVVQPISQARTQVFDCLKTVIDHLEPLKQPIFPKKLPDSISLPIPENGSTPAPATSSGRRESWHRRSRR